MKKKSKNLFAPALISIALITIPLLSASFLSFYFIENESYYTSFSFLEWIGFSLISIFTQSFAITPPTFVSLVLGFFWGWKTLPLVLLINFLSIYLVTLLIKWLGNKNFLRLIESYPKAKKLIAGIQKDELKIIGLAQLSPMMPFTISNIVFILAGAKTKNVLMGSFLGMIPRTILSIWAGTQAKEIKILLENPSDNNIHQIAIIALVAISIIGVFFFIGRALQKLNTKD